MSTLKIDLSNGNRKILQILGGKTRCHILSLISDGKEWSVGAIAKKLGLGVPNISIQVAELERAGLVIKRYSQIHGSNTKLIQPVYESISVSLSNELR